jgi:hypothetical protein
MTYDLTEILRHYRKYPAEMLQIVGEKKQCRALKEFNYQHQLLRPESGKPQLGNYHPADVIMIEHDSAKKLWEEGLIDCEKYTLFDHAGERGFRPWGWRELDKAGDEFGNTWVKIRLQKNIGFYHLPLNVGDECWIQYRFLAQISNVQLEGFDPNTSWACSVLILKPTFLQD